MAGTDIKDKDIVVIGVSHRQDKFGFRIFRDLIVAGFKVEGVNPTNGEIAGKKVFSSLKELGRVPDLVITVVPPQVTEKVVEECRLLGVREIWMQPGSESELAVGKAKEYGISVTSNACFMVRQGLW